MSGRYKRKRSGSSAKYPIRIRSGPITKRRRMFVPGRDRTGGYYGRFAGRGGELKFFDGTIAQSPVSATGNLTNSINLVPQGVEEDQRVGRKMTIKSIHFRFNYRLDEQDAQVTPERSDSLRFIVYLDKQANGATAAITGVLESANIQSFRNLSNKNRFNILLDKTYNLQYQGLASDSAGVVSQAMQIHTTAWNKTCNIPIEFDSTTGAITEIRSNNVGVILITQNAQMIFGSNFRIRYSDY